VNLESVTGQTRGPSVVRSKGSSRTDFPGGREGDKLGNGVVVPDEIHVLHAVPDANPKSIRLDVEPVTGHLSLAALFKSADGASSKKLTAIVSLDYLVERLLQMSQWQSGFACLVASDGTYLAHTDRSQNWPKRLGQAGLALEKEVLKEIQEKNFGTIFGQGAQADIIMGFYRIPTTPWYLILTSQKNSILAPVLRFRYIYLSAVLVSVFCIGLFIRMNTKPVAKSIGEIAEAAERVELGDYTVKLNESRSDEIGRLRRRFNRMVAGLKKKDVIERTFGRYVDKKIAQELMSRPESLRLGGEEHVVTILMADLRGFTPIAKKLQPEQVITLLNRFFSRMIPIIEKHTGIIVDFHGDSILVFFNGIDPDVRVSTSRAITCATEMQHELASVSEQNLRDGLPPLLMGIGIHTGEVIVGNIGSETRAKYGIVGSAVNETDRIQSFARGGKTMISERTYRLVSDLLEVGPKCEVCLKGLEGTLDLFEVRDIHLTDFSPG
jgi:adenylate cyclase